jgi:hypothetical protein
MLYVPRVTLDADRETPRRNVEAIRGGFDYWNSPTEVEPPAAYGEDVVIRSRCLLRA